MISKNPTKTRTIEQSWLREIVRRWKRFERVSIDHLFSVAGLSSPDRIIANDSPVFQMDPSQQRIYMAFLQQMIDSILLGDWQEEYQIQAYNRGIQRTRDALISQGARIVPTAEETARAANVQPFSAPVRTSLVPIHSDALEFLFTRSFDSLKGYTDLMARQTRQALIDGVEQGLSVADVARSISKIQGVSRSRAALIARTETIQAYQRSSTNEARRSSIEIGEEIEMRWQTVLDSNVRHLHATWHGTRVSVEDNFKRITQSPWNCRCGQSPVIPSLASERKEKRFKAERRALLSVPRR